jgi:hypothetical protein
MPNTPASPIIKPSDAVSWGSCARRVWLDDRNDFEFEPPEDELEQLVIEFGLYRRILGTDLPAITFLSDGGTGEVNDEANTITNQFVTEMRELLASDI